MFFRQAWKKRGKKWFKTSCQNRKPPIVFWKWDIFFGCKSEICSMMPGMAEWDSFPNIQQLQNFRIIFYQKLPQIQYISLVESLRALPWHVLLKTIFNIETDQEILWNKWEIIVWFHLPFTLYPEQVHCMPQKSRKILLL